MHWKLQLRSRARKLKAHAQAAGGGPPINGMTEFEEQAITTFGAAAVDGLPGVATLGHQVLPLYLNTAQAPASSPTPTVASPPPAPSLTVASSAPAFPVLSLNFSSSPSPPDSLSPPILSSPMPSPFYIPSEKQCYQKWKIEKSERRRPLLYKGKF
ncbi:LIM domain-binding protein 3-like [Bactrocera neohumeralis]|uniref:LIM domain-binding protein 3-like n=1 Tax=Bactrocera neohumeralis TaxID=98809 RepID=UPI002165D313|nr:LIM domain-binding protein 3-like [Bactrocera neohumeralis]